MDKKALIENLKDVFCQFNKADGNKYTEVWLSDVDFGNLYHSDKFILHVKAEHEISSCSDEIDNVLRYLDEHAHDELQFIWSVYIYDSTDQIHCQFEDLLVYTEAQSCK